MRDDRKRKKDRKGKMKGKLRDRLKNNQLFKGNYNQNNLTNKKVIEI